MSIPSELPVREPCNEPEPKPQGFYDHHKSREAFPQGTSTSITMMIHEREVKTGELGGVRAEKV
jgi:hypothetical protein